MDGRAGFPSLYYGRQSTQLRPLAEYGEDWSGFTEIRLAPEAKLRLVQGMERDRAMPLCGRYWERDTSSASHCLLRFISAAAAGTSADRRGVIVLDALAFEEMFDWIMLRADSAAHSVRRLEMDVAKQRLRLEELVARCERLQEKERSMLAEINELQNWAGAEPISLTFI